MLLIIIYGLTDVLSQESDLYRKDCVACMVQGYSWCGKTINPLRLTLCRPKGDPLID